MCKNILDDSLFNEKIDVEAAQLFAAYIDYERNSPSQAETVMVFVDSKHVIEPYDLRCFLNKDDDFLPSHSRSVEARLLELLENREGISAYDLDSRMGDYDPEDPSYEKSGYEIEQEPTHNPPFTMLCDFMLCDFKALCNEYTALTRDKGKGNARIQYKRLDALIQKYQPVSGLLHLDWDFEQYPYIDDPQESTFESEFIERLSTWENWILLQRFCLCYQKNPEQYGAQGRFDAFRRRNGMLGYSRVSYGGAGQRADGFTSPEYACSNEEDPFLSAYLNDDEEALDQLLQMQIQEIGNMNEAGIVAEDALELLTEMAGLLFQSGLPIKRCKRCGKFFVPVNRGNIEYCSRRLKEDPKRTCQDVGADRVFLDKLNRDPALKEARQIYNRLYSRHKYSPEREDYRTLFETFREQNRIWKDDYKAGRLSQKGYLIALEQWKRC